MNSREEINLDEISIYGILRNLALNFWLVLLAAAGAWFLVTGVKEMSWTPKYTSSAVMAVNSRGTGNDAYSSLSLTSQMAGIFSEVFSSNVLKDRIAQSLGQEEVEAEISAAVVTETNLITLSVTAGDPRQAYMVLQAAIDNYDTVSDYLFSNAVLRMVQEPDIPFAPSNPLRIDRIRTLAAAGAGAAVCACIALLSVMRFTVQTRTGARRNLDGRILETLPFEKKYKTLRERFSRRKKGILITSPLGGHGICRVGGEAGSPAGAPHDSPRSEGPAGEQRGGERGQVLRGGQPGLGLGGERAAGDSHGRGYEEAGDLEIV